jgi:hypothetical protein
MSRRILSLLPVAAFGLSATAAAAEPPPHVFELEGAFAVSYLFAEPAYPDAQLSYVPVGILGRGTLSYRTNYPILPFFSLETAHLASGTATGADGAVFEQSLGAVSYLPGAYVDLAPLRFSFALGFTSAQTAFRSDGATTGSSQIAFSSAVGVSLTLVRTKYFLTNFDVRYVDAGGADVRYLSSGLSLRGDVFGWGQ